MENIMTKIGQMLGLIKVGELSGVLQNLEYARLAALWVGVALAVIAIVKNMYKLLKFVVILGIIYLILTYVNVL